MDLLRALGALAFTLESEQTLAQSLVFLEATLAHALVAERVTIGFGIARPHSPDPCDVTAPLLLDGRSIGFVTVRFPQTPSDRERECVRVFASPLAALVAWRSQTNERGRLYELVRTDALTGLANRMAFDERLDAAWIRARENGTTLCVALLDIDFFKIFNDRYGHVEGDACLRGVAKTLVAEARREEAFVARYGGEEFALIFEAVPHAAAIEAVGRLALAFEESPIPHEGSTLGRISISGGIASLVPSRSHAIADLVRDADRSLYRAKALGRNRICAGSYASQGAVVSRRARSILGPPMFEDITIGRAADVAYVLSALRRTPMISLVGPAGIGKSRLACVAAAAAHDVVTGGIAYVDFSSFARESDPAALLAAALDLEIDMGNLQRGLCEAVKERNALIVLDNVAESVGRRVATLCDELLACAPSLCILSTSRVPLGCQSERTVVVGPLDENASIDLLQSRSGSTDLDYLRVLARRLEGNPAAIEDACRNVRDSHAYAPFGAGHELLVGISRPLTRDTRRSVRNIEP